MIYPILLNKVIQWVLSFSAVDLSFDPGDNGQRESLLKKHPIFWAQDPGPSINGFDAQPQRRQHHGSVFSSQTY
ncbi:hypothetical protein [Desulfospira joergensenii]|uniref:hypothetical protein n=1 Tax=Desulfospira joergensenii TaxID=53329 RepID=UPI0012947D11|nr:hypothetical protein [Desulfospira joergensenii]